MKKMIAAPYHIRLQKKGIMRGKRPEGRVCRLAFLSDIHLACGPREAAGIRRLLEEWKPDILLCGGDTIIGKPGMEVAGAVRFMRELAGGYQIFHAMGNHEYRTRIYPEVYGSMYRDYTDPLREAGVIFLENAFTDLEIRGLAVRIYGYDLPAAYYRRLGKKENLPVSDLEKNLGKPAEDRFTVLLAHNPAYRTTYLDWGADLTLSGHCHGGVIGLGGGRGLVSPDFRILPAKIRGSVGCGDRHMIISAGLGEHTIPLRIHNPRELVLIEAEVKSEDSYGD